eukprot:4366029-Amphidinium_carterae.1
MREATSGEHLEPSKSLVASGHVLGCFHVPKVQAVHLGEIFVYHGKAHDCAYKSCKIRMHCRFRPKGHPAALACGVPA